jgi:hypothetical protein
VEQLELKVLRAQREVKDSKEHRVLPDQKVQLDNQVHKGYKELKALAVV